MVMVAFIIGLQLFFVVAWGYGRLALADCLITMPFFEIYGSQSFSSFMLLAGVRFRTTIVRF
jgi:hypothetical protein